MKMLILWNFDEAMDLWREKTPTLRLVEQGRDRFYTNVQSSGISQEEFLAGFDKSGHLVAEYAKAYMVFVSKKRNNQ